MNWLDGLIPLQFHHQIGEPPIRLHQLRRGTHKPIRQLTHAAKESILEDPLRLIHKVGKLNREAIHTSLIARGRCDLRNDDGPAVSSVHGFQVANALVAVGTVVVEADVVRWGGRSKVHELFEPSLPILIVGHRGTHEFLPPVLSQRHHLVVPSLRRALRSYVVLVGLVEEMDDGLLAVEYILPVSTGELRFEVDHGSVGCSAVEFGGAPGVPVADGGDGAVKIALIHGPWYSRIAGTGAVGPVPEETAFFDYHG